MIRTYPIEEIAADICGDSMADPVRWLTRQIASGRITARKVGRHWRMTAADVEAALEVFANRAAPTPAPIAAPVAAPTPIARPSAASMRRRMAVAQ